MSIRKKLRSGLYQEVEQSSFKNFILHNLIMKAIIMFIILFFSILLYESVSKLVIINPNLFMICCAIILILFFGLAVYFYRKKVVDGPITDKDERFYNIYDIASFVLLTVSILYFIMMFVVTPSGIIGTSMSPTLEEDEKILVWHLGYTPKRNDVVIIDVNKKHYDIYEESFFIKRAVAIAGDKITLKDGYLYINDIQFKRVSFYEYDKIIHANVNNEIISIIDENYIIKKNFLICIGDNYEDSTDSRIIGAIHQNDILGKAIYRIYPFHKMKKI